MKWVIVHENLTEEVFTCEVNARVTFAYYTNARLYVEFQNGSFVKRYEVK